MNLSLFNWKRELKLGRSVIHQIMSKIIDCKKFDCRKKYHISLKKKNGKLLIRKSRFLSQSMFEYEVFKTEKSKNTLVLKQKLRPVFILPYLVSNLIIFFFFSICASESQALYFIGVFGGVVIYNIIFIFLMWPARTIDFNFMIKRLEKICNVRLS